MPVGAALVSERVASAIGFGDHGTTYGGNLLACRAALFVLDQLEEHGLLAHIARAGAHLEAALRALASRHAAAVEVRGKGLMWGLVLDRDATPVVGAALAPLSRAVAEVRSLVVDEAWRGRGLGTRLVEELGARARRAGFTVLSAFTHDPHHFVRLGFSIVPHVWFPEKVAIDCTGCARFRVCGQHAMALSLTGASLLPTLRRLREPLTAHATPGDTVAALRPVRLRVIA
jgi:N-acetylglutamate synthase-like GNAT family acetyltransferase